jgi:hypothetical protein
MQQFIHWLRCGVVVRLLIVASAVHACPTRTVSALSPSTPGPCRLEYEPYPRFYLRSYRPSVWQHFENPEFQLFDLRQRLIDRRPRLDDVHLHPSEFVLIAAGPMSRPDTAPANPFRRQING